MSHHQGARGLLLAAMACLGLLVAGSPAIAQNVVVDANVFWDNDGGDYAADAGGAACFDGPYVDNADFATRVFDNLSANPLLSDPHNLAAPDWSPMVGSAALPGHPGYRVVKIWDVDPWFSEVCYNGGAAQGERWWEGWTYFNYNDGAGRTDIPAGFTDVVSDIAGNTFWAGGVTYRLNGRIAVKAGATLTIAPGAVIVGAGPGSYLVVERDGDIVANGTQGAPIIMTSGSAPGSQFPGDWGGLVIMGKAVANCAGVTGCGLTSVVGDCESEGGAGFFGGSDDNDSSGSLRFVRVEYAGQEISPNNELNAFTFNAVGRGTQISYLQAHLGTDDLFEWFGGTMQAKYLVATGGDDDNFDWQMGYRGRVQFAVCQQADIITTPNADAGIEADNNEFDEQCAGRSNPILSNLTLVGTGPEAGGSRGIRLRRGTAGTVVNSVIAGWSNVGLRVEPSSLDNCSGATPADAACGAKGDSLIVDANIFFDNDGGSYAADTGGSACWHGLISNTQLATVLFDNRTIDPMISDPYNKNAPDWSPQAGSPTLPNNANHRVVEVWNTDGFFDQACYAGAADFNERWWEGWTYFNYADGAGRTDIPGGAPIDVVADVNANTTWFSGNVYRLNGRIAVNPPATLTIQAGTVIVGAGVGSYLVVERNADIDVQGTASQPVIFTSGSAPGSQFPGDWGGVVVHGNAVANCAGVTGCGLTSVVGDCESEGGAGFFGGSDDNDSSGSLRFVRVEYAGQEISPNNELNAFTFNAVGRGTQISYLQAHLGTDDLFEWFGGTMQAKYLVATGGDDDNFDWQMGYRGRVQFAVCQQADIITTPNADAGIEADNNEFDEQCAGRSNPILSNLTLVGTGPDAGGSRGIRLRRGTAGCVVNSVVMGFSNVGLRVEPSSLDNCAAQVAIPDANCDDVILGTGDATGLRNGFVALAAPNPTRGAADISFALEREGRVTVNIYDVTGRVVDVLADEWFTAGAQSVRWDGASSSGMYFYRVVTDNGDVATGKIVVSR